MDEIIEKHEEAIVNYYDSIMHEIFEENLPKHNVGADFFISLEEAKELNEVKDIATIKRIFSEYNILGLFTLNAVESLEGLEKEVEELKKKIIDQDKELLKSLESICEIVRKILNDYYLDVESEKLDMECRFVVRRKPELLNYYSEEKEPDEESKRAQRALDLQVRLRSYIATFIKSIEKIFTKAKKYLDNGEIEIDLNSTISKVIEFCSEIDSLKTIGLLTKEISIYFGKRKIKEIAKLPASIIESCAGRATRPIFAKGAYKIFAHYEQQFHYLPLDGTENKVASDSANRFISYLLKNPMITEIKSEDVVKGIVEGRSLLNPSKLFCKTEHTINTHTCKPGSVVGKKYGDEVTIDDFFKRTVKCEVVDDKLVHYMTDDTLYDPTRDLFLLGFRLKFPWEDLSTYTIIEAKTSYDNIYTKEKEAQQISAIYEKIYRRRYVDPEKGK